MISCYQFDGWLWRRQVVWKLRELADSGDCGLEHGFQGGRGIREIGNGKQADPA